MEAMALFLIAGPVFLGLYGLALLLNLFGATSGQVAFYRGREDWYPVLSGGQQSTHRLVGAVLAVFGAVMTVAVVEMGVL